MSPIKKANGFAGPFWRKLPPLDGAGNTVESFFLVVSAISGISAETKRSALGAWHFDLDGGDGRKSGRSLSGGASYYCFHKIFTS